MKQTFIFFIFYLCLSIAHTFGQVAKCKPDYILSTPPWDCVKLIDISDIDNGSTNYDTAYISTTLLSKIDSTYAITLTVAKINGNQSQCITNLAYKDRTAPVPIARQNINAKMDVNGQTITLTPELVDGGSYDNCGGTLQYEVIPSILDCEAENPTFVILRVTDEHDNYNETWAKINLPFDKNSTLMKCNDTTFISIKIDEEIEVTPDMVLYGGPYKCFSDYTVELKNHGSPILTHLDEFGLQQATVKDKKTFKSCVSKIKVTLVDCSPTFFVCDFKSRCEPAGDCTSGHSLTDFVEWPCDIDISVPTSLFNNPNSESIAEYLKVPKSETGPRIKNDSCAIIGVNTEDKIEIIADGKLIRRTWQLINWRTQEKSPKYTQILKLKKLDNECNICDTKPWNTPLGDCNSGHTSTDQVEWPSDLKISKNRIGIYDLTNNPTIVNNDRSPIIDNKCSEFHLNFVDQISKLSPLEYNIKRNWAIYNSITQNVYNYTQNIEVDSLPQERKVCTLDAVGNPILNVQLQGNLFINDIECTTFDFNPALPIVTPFKEGSFLDNIDINDQILLTEYILKIKEYNDAQFYAADVDQDNILTIEDLKLLNKLVNGDTSYFINLTTPWKFYLNTVGTNKNLNLSFADVTNPLYTYQFTGVKLGDIDKSSTTSTTNTEFIFEDQILTNGQSYDISVKTTSNHKIKGIQFKLLKSDNFELKYISSILPDLVMVETATAYLFNWSASKEQMLNGGISIAKGADIFTFKIKSNFNQILNEIFIFGDKSYNKMSVSGDISAYNILFKSSNLIPNNTTFELDTRYKIFPNPTLSFAKIELPEGIENVTLELFNTSSKKIFSQQYRKTETLDLSLISSGIYIVKIIEANGKCFIGKLLKY